MRWRLPRTEEQNALSDYVSRCVGLELLRRWAMNEWGALGMTAGQVPLVGLGAVALVRTRRLCRRLLSAFAFRQLQISLEVAHGSLPRCEATV